VVSPNLNEARYLPTFLKSLVNQSFKWFNVIIVDGESTDNSLEIIDRFRPGLLNIRVVVCGTRNIGYIRNLGARYVKDPFMLQTNSDTYLPPRLLENVFGAFMNDNRLVALSGRTYPLESPVLGHLAYGAFDLARCMFSRAPKTIRRFRPGGSFIAVRTKFFRRIGGFPELRINEDGALGKQIDLELKTHWGKAAFTLKEWVGHYPKRFHARGTVKTVLFYFYVLGELMPLLKPFVKHIEIRSAETFVSRSDLQ